MVILKSILFEALAFVQRPSKLKLSRSDNLDCRQIFILGFNLNMKILEFLNLQTVYQCDEYVQMETMQVIFINILIEDQDLLTFLVKVF